MKWMTAKKAAEKVIRQNVNSACIYILHQPKLPESALEKFRKMK